MNNRICIKRKLLWITVVLYILSFQGCTVSKDATEKTTASYLAYGGINYGGFIEDTEIDAISGATSMQYNFGLHSEIAIRNKYRIETGLDYIKYKQTLDFNDTQNDYTGKTDFNYSQLRVPVTYNFSLLKNSDNRTVINFKAGMSFGYNIFEDIKIHDTAPDYIFNKFTYAFNIGFSSVPVKISEKITSGIYLDFIRGSKQYEDFYHGNNETGLISNLNFGIVFRYK